jgi:hypothetical protein
MAGYVYLYVLPNLADLFEQKGMIFYCLVSLYCLS